MWSADHIMKNRILSDNIPPLVTGLIFGMCLWAYYLIEYHSITHVPILLRGYSDLIVSRKQDPVASMILFWVLMRAFPYKYYPDSQKHEWRWKCFPIAFISSVFIINMPLFGWEITMLFCINLAIKHYVIFLLSVAWMLLFWLFERCAVRLPRSC